MQKRITIIFIICASLPIVVFPSVEKAKGTLILEGQSIGSLKLADSRERAVKLFPLKPNLDEEHTYPFCGPRTELHWIDAKYPETWGVFIFLRDNRVFQIESGTSRFQTRQGITFNSPPSVIRKYFSSIKTYQLRYSAANISGGRDLIYWVDQSKGIAFELYFNRTEDERRVNRISVFKPGTEFFPEGCIVPPQEWIELAPFSLEPPNAQASLSLLQKQIRLIMTLIW